MAGKSSRFGRGQQSRAHATKEFAVIGLGRFGGSVARRLEAMGHIVLGVDIDIARVQEYSDEITYAVALDATVEDALQEVDIASFGTVIISVGEDFEATALIAAYLKGLGIPRVICMGKTRRHRDILLRIGADRVIVSDEDSGVRLAEVLAAPDFLERVALDADRSVTEFKAPSCVVGRPLSSLSRYDVTVLLIQRPDSAGGSRLIPCPDSETLFEAGDTVLAVGLRRNLIEVASLT